MWPEILYYLIRILIKNLTFIPILEISKLRTIISQNCKPIALYIIKLTGSHMSYTVTQKELLSTVETLK